MKFKSMYIAISIFVIIFGSIAVTKALGMWKTTTDKVPATYKDGEFAGQYNPADIRGSYTFGDIFSSFDIPVEDLGKAFGVQDSSKYSEFQVKELEGMYATSDKEIGTGSVRYFVALYKGLPITLTEDTYLPKAAVDILKAKVKLTDEQIKSLEKISVDVSPAANTQVPAATAKPEAVNTEKTIKGSTTFKEMIDWGIKKEDIEKVINDKLPDTSKIIKDYATAKGIEFSTIKDPLQKLADAAKK